MSRYTSKSLEYDLVAINAKLAERGHKYRLIIGGRYGYTAIDLATVEQAASFCIQSTLICGTPRECLAAAHAYCFRVL